MKYKAGKLDSGKWAVISGKDYFPDTSSSSRKDAERLAIEFSIKWHQRQIDIIFAKAQKDGVLDENDLRNLLA